MQILQFDMWNVTPSGMHDWDVLRADIKKHGIRNSLLLAPMPTASTAQILGNNESIEPYTSNIYTRRVLSGEFQVQILFMFGFNVAFLDKKIYVLLNICLKICHKILIDFYFNLRKKLKYKFIDDFCLIKQFYIFIEHQIHFTCVPFFSL